MQRVRLHVAGNGEIWALSRCSACGDVNKHLAADAIVGEIDCKQCGHKMDMRVATIEAVAAVRDSLGQLPDSVE